MNQIQFAVLSTAEFDHIRAAKMCQQNTMLTSKDASFGRT